MLNILVLHVIKTGWYLFRNFNQVKIKAEIITNNYKDSFESYEGWAYSKFQRGNLRNE